MSNRTFIQIAIVVTVFTIYRKNKRMAEARARRLPLIDVMPRDWTNQYFDTRMF